MSRIAVLSDIHGNLPALEAVLADIEEYGPDRVMLGGDIAGLGPRPAEVVDILRVRGWPAVVGNWDRAMEDTEENRQPALPAGLLTMLEVLVPWTRDRLGAERLAWLRALPADLRDGTLTVVHAEPSDLWRAPVPEDDDQTFRAIFRDAGPLVVYAHIHRPFVRNVGAFVVANTGSVGLPFDGDPRASYLRIEDGVPEIRRVQYDVDRAIADLYDSDFPLADSVAESLRTAAPIQPKRS